MNHKYWFCINFGKYILCSYVFLELVLVSRLVPLEYSISFSDIYFSFIYKPGIVGNGTLFDGLYSMNFEYDTNKDALNVHADI